MKVVTYKYEEMAAMTAILDQIQFIGIKSARAVTEIANILDAGTVTDVEEKADPDGEDIPADTAAGTDGEEQTEKEQQNDE